MKARSIVIRLAAFILCLLLTGCAFPGVLNRLPDYEAGGLHSCIGWQDSTDYGEYTFSEVTPRQLQLSGYFRIVTEADLETLRLYVEDFAQWIALCEDCEECDLAEVYSFSPEFLEAGDYFGLECAEPRGSFLGDYTIYYFDMDAQTFYYLRSNI